VANSYFHLLNQFLALVSQVIIIKGFFQFFEADEITTFFLLSTFLGVMGQTLIGGQSNVFLRYLPGEKIHVNSIFRNYFSFFQTNYFYLIFLFLFFMAVVIFLLPNFNIYLLFTFIGYLIGFTFNQFFVLILFLKGFAHIVSILLIIDVITKSAYIFYFKNDINLLTFYIISICIYFLVFMVYNIISSKDFFFKISLTEDRLSFSKSEKILKFHLRTGIFSWLQLSSDRYIISGLGGEINLFSLMQQIFYFPFTVAINFFGSILGKRLFPLHMEIFSKQLLIFALLQTGLFLVIIFFSLQFGELILNWFYPNGIFNSNVAALFCFLGYLSIIHMCLFLVVQKKEIHQKVSVIYLVGPIFNVFFMATSYFFYDIIGLLVSQNIYLIIIIIYLGKTLLDERNINY